MRDQNNKLHRFLALMLVMSVALTCACSKKKDSSEKESSTESEETTTKTQESASETSETTPSSETSESTIESTTESTTDTSATDSSDTSDTSSTPAQSVPSTFDKSKADSYLSSIKFDGVVLVYENGQIVYTHEAGMADRDKDIPNTMDTVFELGSITKQFTAVAIMQLVEQNKLSLDDTLDKYIPEYKYAKDITIHQLLNMTSGVPDYLYCGVLGFTMDDLKNFSLSSFLSLQSMLGEVATTPMEKDDLVKRISEYSLNFTPGTKLEYSNTNYYFLGMIIEQLSGLSYEDYIHRNILDPLGLTELYPDTRHLTSNGRTDFTLFHFDFPHQHETLSYAVGVMTGTAEGLLEWEKKVMERPLLTEESWNKIFDRGEFGYGYGWYIWDGYIEHSGMTLGYNTTVRVDPDSGKVIIVLCNIQTFAATPERPLAADVGAELWSYFG
ncbi:MAG: beta-lactamase family protein [Clostridiales bacterium]|nr:beta-lactamase family protein [Clostridiales bacterium]